MSSPFFMKNPSPRRFWEKEERKRGWPGAIRQFRYPVKTCGPHAVGGCQQPWDTCLGLLPARFHPAVSECKKHLLSTAMGKVSSTVSARQGGLLPATFHPAVSECNKHLLSTALAAASSTVNARQGFHTKGGPRRCPAVASARQGRRIMNYIL